VPVEDRPLAQGQAVTRDSVDHTRFAYERPAGAADKGVLVVPWVAHRPLFAHKELHVPISVSPGIRPQPPRGLLDCGQLAQVHRPPAAVRLVIEGVINVVITPLSSRDVGCFLATVHRKIK
jgi:hypothetical protein